MSVITHGSRIGTVRSRWGRTLLWGRCPWLLMISMATACGIVNQDRRGSDTVQTFNVGGQVVTIGTDDLEKIRTAVVDQLRNAADDISKTLADELAGAIAVVGPDDTRLGQWVLTERGNGLALVRIPPRAAVNYMFVARLDRQNGRWLVTNIDQERMMAR